MANYDILQSSTAYPLMFLMLESADHITPLTGASPTVVISKNGGAFASPSGAVSEIANGWYKVAGNATDSATLGALVLHATATSGDPSDCLYQVVAYSPQDAVHLGLSSLPNASASASGGLLTVGTSAGQISPTSGGVDIQTIKTQTITCAASVTIYPAVGSANELSVTAGGIAKADIQTVLTNAVTVDANNVLNVSTKYIGGTLQTARDLGASVLLSSGTGTGQIKISAGYVSPNWADVGSPTTTVGLTGTTFATSQVVASVTGNVGGNVVGSVASVSGAVGSVTGNVGGNVAGSVASVTAPVSLTTAESKVLQTGTATAGAGATITLQTALGTTADIVGCMIKISSGTGANQTRVITAYVNSTKIVTVDYAWVTAPDNTSIYTIYFDNAPILNSSLFVTASSTGGTVNVGFVNGISTIGVTTINANIGTIQPITFDANNFQKVDLVDVGGTAITSSGGILAVNASQINGITPTMGASLTFPTSLASPTNITAGTITTVSGNVNGSLGGNVQGSVFGDVGGKILGQGVSVFTAVGVQADVQTIKTQAVTCAASVTIYPAVGAAYEIGVTAAGKISEVVLVDTVTTYTGNTPQTGDTYAYAVTNIGTAGVGLANLGDSRIAHLDANVSSRSTLTQSQVSGYAGPILTDNTTGLVTANTTQFNGSNVVNTGGKLWVLDGSGNAIATASVLATVNTQTTSAAQIANVESGLTSQGFTTALATGIGTTNAAAVNATYGFAAIEGLVAALPSASVNATAVWNQALPGSFASGTAGYILGHLGAGADPWATALPGSYSAGQAGYILGGHVILGPVQSFTNTMQGQQGNTVLSNSSVSTTYSNATIYAQLNYPLVVNNSYQADLTGWTQLLFSVKPATPTADSASTILLVLSNPGDPGDGLQLQNGNAPVSPVVAASGALSLTITNAGLTNARTIIGISLDAYGMGLSAAAEYRWELTWFFDGIKQPALDGGAFSATQLVRLSPSQQPG